MRHEEPLGPPSDSGWTRCHGCSAIFDHRGLGTHALDCPHLCVRPDCDYHPKVT